MKDVSQMTIDELIQRMAELETENAKLKEAGTKFTHRSEREVFRFIPEDVKKDLFGYKADKRTGKVVSNYTEPIMNDNWVYMIFPLLFTVDPRLKTYPSSKAKYYQKAPVRFNEYDEEGFKIIKEMVLKCVDAVYEAKCKLGKFKEEEK